MYKIAIKLQGSSLDNNKFFFSSWSIIFC